MPVRCSSRLLYCATFSGGTSFSAIRSGCIFTSQLTCRPRFVMLSVPLPYCTFHCKILNRVDVLGGGVGVGVGVGVATGVGFGVGVATVVGVGVGVGVGVAVGASLGGPPPT